MSRNIDAFTKYYAIFFSPRETPFVAFCLFSCIPCAFCKERLCLWGSQLFPFRVDLKLLGGDKIFDTLTSLLVYHSLKVSLHVQSGVKLSNQEGTGAENFSFRVTLMK